MTKRITKEEFLRFAVELEGFHGIFSQLWSLGRPSLDENLEPKTACVAFDKDGDCIDFRFHPEYWTNSKKVKKQFTISHECMHVILNHGKRIGDVGGFESEYNKTIANYAADIVINESLVAEFGFDRDEIDPLMEEEKPLDPDKPEMVRKFCWLDNLFKEELKNKKIKKDGSFEYYYYQLKKKYPPTKFKMMAGKCETVDDHSGLDSFSEKAQKEIQEEIEKNLSPEELEDLAKKLENCEKTDKDGNPEKESDKQRGSIAGNIARTMKVGRVKKKKKWETVIKKWVRKHTKNTHKDVEQWAVLNRRFTMLPQDMFLPSDFEMEDNEKEKSKIDVLFFQDTSGSCSHLAPRFFKAAKSLPEDRFNIKMCCFDTAVYETTLESGKLYGFGGTDFDILEDYVQAGLKKGELSRYPDAVFVITDGYGNNIRPAKPKNWYWFLSESNRSCIPKECNIFDLNKFE
jgi:hypothetical protein